MPFIRKYSGDTYLSWETIRVVVDLDMSDGRSGVYDSRMSADTVRCSVRALLEYASLQMFERCRHELHIDNVMIEKENTKDPYESEACLRLAEANAEFAGMRVVYEDECRKSVGITELYDDDRTVKPRFYMQKIFNEIGESAQHI